MTTTLSSFSRPVHRTLNDSLIRNRTLAEQCPAERRRSPLIGRNDRCQLVMELTEFDCSDARSQANFSIEARKTREKIQFWADLNSEIQFAGLNELKPSGGQSEEPRER